jgi:hypothetical protein
MRFGAPAAANYGIVTGAARGRRAARPANFAGDATFRARGANL